LQCLVCGTLTLQVTTLNRVPIHCH
jgi:hypothetical protein